MRCFLTGGTGFLGRALLPRLAERGEVVALHRRQAAPRVDHGVRWVTQDLATALHAELPERVDVVVHLAQSLRYREFPEQATDIFGVNTASTMRLLEYARRAGATHFVFTSTGAVYAPGPRAVREDDAPSPPNFYARTKLMAEQAVLGYASHLHVTVLRPFFVYGPGQQADRFLPGLVSRIRDGRPITLAGSDGIRLNPVYVDDAADAVLGALALEGANVLNLAGPDVVSIRGVAELVGRALDEELTYERGPQGDDLVASVDRLTERLGPPRISMSEGIERTLTAC